MGRGDRGTLAVCLFDLHDTSHYEDAREVRENADMNKLKSIVQALVNEVGIHGWNNHEFCQKIKERDKRIIAAIRQYGIGR
jgi:hypothetical protein